MSLQAPNLDSRRFDDLVKEARERIPRFTPDWTNFNDSDPGMTLVKLQAWLTETLLFELNRLPELNYIKFLQLLQVAPTPAKAAGAELLFTLKKLSESSDPLAFFIPKNTQVETDDPDLETPVVFETTRTLAALNAKVAAIIAVNDAGTPGAGTYKLVSSYDQTKAELAVNNSFFPFGAAPSGGAICLIGLLLRPHRKNNVDYSQDVFPAGELDLYASATQVFDLGVDGAPIEGPLAGRGLLPHEQGELAQAIEWEIYIGKDHTTDFPDRTANAGAWRPVFPPDDETAGLSRSGHIRPALPAAVSQVAFSRLPRSFWLELDLIKPPTTRQELIDDLRELPFALVDAIDLVQQLLINPDSDVLACDCATTVEFADALESSGEALNMNNLDAATLLDLQVGYSDPPVPEYAMAWLRARLVEPAAYKPHALKHFALNTVPAVAAVTRNEEPLGKSNGRPGQQFSLAKKPVLFDPVSGSPELEIDVEESGRREVWTWASDFFRADSQSKVFLLDGARGLITFGDGEFGQIPVAGATISARFYRYGGGRLGNVGADTITKLRTSVPRVDRVTNPRAAAGGADAETLEQVKLRAPHDLQTRDRAVTAEDFAHLALRTTGVAVHSAYALPRTAVSLETQALLERDGAVTVVVLPANDEQAAPQPSESQLRTVSAFLDQRRLITTELYVTGPRYLSVRRLAAEILVHPSGDLTAVSEQVLDNLLVYFHPLKGGDRGTGWPFGEDIFFGNIYERLLEVPAVRRVINLEVDINGVPSTDGFDVRRIPPGHLVQLSREALDLKVRYE